MDNEIVTYLVVILIKEYLSKESRCFIIHWLLYFHKFFIQFFLLTVNQFRTIIAYHITLLRFDTSATVYHKHYINFFEEIGRLF